MAKSMEALNRALDEESYEYMLTHAPMLVKAIETELKKGATPEEIKWAVVRQTKRYELALRCEQCARWLAGE